MTKTELKKRYLTGAIATAGIVMAIVAYTVVVEVLRRMGHQPPIQPPTAYFLKYFFYFLGVSALGIVKLANRAFSAPAATPQEALDKLAKFAIVKAGLCELPAIAGLLLFILTGYYADFYLLVVFSLGLEIYNFPRLSEWEERLRGQFGQLPE